MNLPDSPYFPLLLQKHYFNKYLHIELSFKITMSYASEEMLLIPE